MTFLYSLHNIFMQDGVLFDIPFLFMAFVLIKGIFAFLFVTFIHITGIFADGRRGCPTPGLNSSWP